MKEKIRSLNHRSNGNIEVLRCFLMFLIVLGHCATFTRICSHDEARLIHTFQIFAVDAFVLITGWFGIRYSSSKIWRFLGLGMFSSVVVFLLSPFSQFGWTYNFSLGWFGNAYLGLLVLAPILNAAEESLIKMDKGWLFKSWALYAVMMVVSWLPLSWFNIDVKIIGWEAHSMNQLMFMYWTGRVLSQYQWTKKIQVWKILIASIMLMAANFGWAIATGLTRQSAFWQSILVHNKIYNNPIVIALSVSVFLIFIRVGFPAFLKNACTFLGPSMFSVYLLHEASSHLVSVSLYSRYLVFYRGTDLTCRVCSVALTACLVFSICVIIDLIRRFAGHLITRYENKF